VRAPQSPVSPDLTDTHCHLYLHQFDADREETLARARKAGLTRILVPGIDLETSRQAVALAEHEEIVYAAVGVHPNYTANWNDETRTALAELAVHPKVVAIGEIGLDFYWDWSPPERQREVLQEMLSLAEETRLPVVVHNRDAGHEVLPLFAAWQNNLARSGSPLAESPGVLHSYSGNIKDAQGVLEAGFFLGFTGPVTFKKAAEMHEVARQMPPDRMLIETDAPYLTPDPFRGKRNEPAYVSYVAGRIAELRETSPEEVVRQTGLNAKNLFKW
jgi:TatD DNase family protein